MSLKECALVDHWILKSRFQVWAAFKGAVQGGQLSVSPNREHQDDITWERKEARWRTGGGGGRGRICGGKGAEPTSGERESRVSSQVERLLRVSLEVVAWSDFIQEWEWLSRWLWFCVAVKTTRGSRKTTWTVQIWSQNSCNHRNRHKKEKGRRAERWKEKKVKQRRKRMM